MSRNRTMTQLTGATLALLLSGGGYSAPSATGQISFTPLSLKDSGGAPLEQAVVSYQDQYFSVSLEGLGVGGAAGQTVGVRGEVYGLNQFADLEGDYVTELADAPPNEVSSDDLWLFSERGVSLHLHTGNPAVTLAAGSDRVKVQFGQSQ